MDASNTFVRLERISKSYRMGETTNAALKDVTVTFEPSCFDALAGPSGCGKTTLLNIMGCLDEPTGGKYYFEHALVDFRNKKQLSNFRKNNFGFVFQSFNLVPVLNALENVELPLSLFRMSAEEAESKAVEMLSAVGLAEKVRSLPSQLSGGEQQRVSIARALVTNPRIVFADEPTANLDRRNAEKIIRLMRELNGRFGSGFVFASHDPLIVSEASNVYELDDGHIARR